MKVKLRTRKIKSGILYFLDYESNGRKRETLKIPYHLDPKERKRLAELQRAKKQLSLDVDKGFVKPATKLYSLMQIYIDSYNKKDYRKILNGCEAFKRNCKDILISQVTKVDVMEFKDYLIENYSTDTGQSYFKSVSKVFTYAVDNNLLDSNPFKKVKNIPAKKDFTKDYATKEDILKMKYALCPNKEVKRAYLFCTQTGLGNTDCRMLKYEDIKDNMITGVRGKSRSQEIPLNKFALELLGSGTGFVFDLPSDNSLNKNVRKLAKNAGINKYFTFYSARHSFATNLLSSGVDLERVRILMGHSSYKYLLRYLQRNKDRERDAVNLL